MNKDIVRIPVLQKFCQVIINGTDVWHNGLKLKTLTPTTPFTSFGDMIIGRAPNLFLRDALKSPIERIAYFAGKISDDLCEKMWNDCRPADFFLPAHIEETDCRLCLLPAGLHPKKWIDMSGKDNNLMYVSDQPEMPDMQFVYDRVPDMNTIELHTGNFSTNISGSTGREVRIPHGYAVEKIVIVNNNNNPLTDVKCQLMWGQELFSGETIATDKKVCVIPVPRLRYNAKATNSLLFNATGNGEGGMNIILKLKYTGQ